jgi:hypothetical protein
MPETQLKKKKDTWISCLYEKCDVQVPECVCGSKYYNLSVTIYGLHTEDMRSWATTCLQNGERVARASRLLLTARSTAILENLTVPQLVKKFPALYVTRWFTDVFTRAHHWSLISTIPSYFPRFTYYVLSTALPLHRNVAHKFPSKTGWLTGSASNTINHTEPCEWYMTYCMCDTNIRVKLVFLYCVYRSLR